MSNALFSMEGDTMKNRSIRACVNALAVSSVLIVAPFVFADSSTHPSMTESDNSAPKAAKKDCDMTFHLKGWSAVYRTAKGEGTISCDSGQTANVTISVHGGGLTFGKSEIFDGKAEISGVRSINDIFGSYIAGE